VVGSSARRWHRAHCVGPDQHLGKTADYASVRFASFYQQSRCYLLAHEPVILSAGGQALGTRCDSAGEQIRVQNGYRRRLAVISGRAIDVPSDESFLRGFTGADSAIGHGC
jgi:hypothetical protein